MKIVCLSDTHMKHDKIVVPEGDILVHCGDSTRRGELQDIAEVNRWLGTLPHKHKIIISGNHDFGFEVRPKEARALITNAIYLEDDEVIVEGIRIYGSPWQPWFHSWAFNLRRGKPIAEKWAKIPEGIDVLLTHGPPHGILDLTTSKEAVGCEELASRIRFGLSNPPRLSVFGHIHESYGQIEIGKTRFVNASSCNRNYEPVHPPIVIEL